MSRLVHLLLGLGSVLVAHLLQLIQASSDLLLERGMIVDDVTCGISGELANAPKMLLQDVPCLLRSGHAHTLLRDILQFAIRFLDDIVNLFAMLITNGIEVVKRAVNVARRTRDEGGVRFCRGAEPLQRYVGIRGRFLELLSVALERILCLSSGVHEILCAYGLLVSRATDFR